MVPTGAVFIKGDLKQEAKLRELAGRPRRRHPPGGAGAGAGLGGAPGGLRGEQRRQHGAAAGGDAPRGRAPIVFSSSATVYGAPQRLPLREDDPLGVQSNPYGATKVAAEAFVAAYQRLYGFDATILRYFNPYGPNELCEPETHLSPTSSAPRCQDEPIPIYWKGEQVRDFIYVEDLARAHVAVLGQKASTTSTSAARRA